MGFHNLPTEFRPSFEGSKDLIQQYLLATSGVLDLFDAEDLLQQLPHLLQGNSSDQNEFTSSIYYLVFAIGTQARCDRNDENLAEMYFNYGRQLAMLSFMDDPSVLTIQSYALITMYMLGACRRNGAFMNLGIAVRAAHALGLHRHDTSSLFCARECQIRERVWKSIRVLDLFLSASLGRPFATSEVENDVMTWNRSAGQHEGSIDAQSFSAVVSICFIFERILTEVYGKRMVSTDLVESISQQHREWTAALPTGLKIDGLSKQDDDSSGNLRQVIGRTHLSNAFYWSIILLTRPFLVYQVSARIKNKGSREDTNGSDGHSPLISTFADACVDSAVRSMDIIDSLLQQPNLPKTLPLVINSIFVNALVVGVAFFGDFDRSFPLNRGLDQAENGLRFFGRFDPTGRRYVQIIEYLRAAVKTYVGKRDRREMENRRKVVSHMFGQVLGSPPESETSGNSGISPPSGRVEQHYNHENRQDAQNMVQYSASHDINQLDSAPVRQNGSHELAPTITTSGFFANSMPLSNPQNVDQVFTMLPPYSESGISQLSPESSSLPSYVEEIPLFSILNDFDPIFNGNFTFDAG
jgi:hypothetical protein